MWKGIVVAGMVAVVPAPSSAWTMVGETKEGGVLCTSHTGRSVANYSMNDDQLKSLGCLRAGGGVAIEVDSEAWNGRADFLRFTIKTPKTVVIVWGTVSDVKITKPY